jgi:Holliday junction resolvase RusA-like endonuclease
MAKMHTLNIKPLSVNDAWKGRRFKSDKYKQYAKDVRLLLPKQITIPKGELGIRFHFYFSNKASDWDNPIKPLQDVICACYGIDDRHIYLAIIEKFIVKKGQEKIEFEIFEYKP